VKSEGDSMIFISTLICISHTCQWLIIQSSLV